MTNRPLQKFVLVLSLSMFVIALCGCTGIGIKDGRAIWKQAKVDKRLVGVWYDTGPDRKTIFVVTRDRKANVLTVKSFSVKAGKLAPNKGVMRLRSLGLGSHHFLVFKPSNPAESKETKQRGLEHARLLIHYTIEGHKLQIDSISHDAEDRAVKAGQLTRDEHGGVPWIDQAHLPWLKKVAADKTAWGPPDERFEKVKDLKAALQRAAKDSDRTLPGITITPDTQPAATQPTQ